MLGSYDTLRSTLQQLGAEVPNFHLSWVYAYIYIYIYTQAKCPMGVLVLNQIPTQTLFFSLLSFLCLFHCIISSVCPPDNNNSFWFFGCHKNLANFLIKFFFFSQIPHH
jgi:hypothetical protein